MAQRPFFNNFRKIYEKPPGQNPEDDQFIQSQQDDNAREGDESDYDPNEGVPNVSLPLPQLDEGLDNYQLTTGPSQWSDPNYAAASVEGRQNELYHPQTRMTDLFQNMLMNPPVERQPSKWDAIISGAAGFLSNPLNSARSIALTRNLLDYPNLKAEADYQQRLKNVAVGAGQERLNNVNDRQYARDVATQEFNARKQTETERKNRDDAAIRQQRANTYQQRVDQEVNRGAKILTDKDTGQSFLVYLDGSRVPLNMALMTPEKMLELKQRGAMDLARFKAGAAKDLKQTEPATAPIYVTGTDEEGKPAAGLLNRNSKNPSFTPTNRIEGAGGFVPQKPPPPPPAPTFFTETGRDAKGNITGTIDKTTTHTEPRVRIISPDGTRTATVPQSNLEAAIKTKGSAWYGWKELR